MKFYSEKLLDGSEEKSELVKTQLTGNTVVFTIKSSFGNDRVMNIDLGIYCDMESKKNYITYLRNYSPSYDDTLNFKPLTYDPYEMEIFKLYFKQVFKIFNIWYGADEVNKKLF